MTKTSEVVLSKWIERRGQLMGWITGGTIIGSVLSFILGFVMGFFGGPFFGGHHSVSGFDQQHQESMLPWLVMWTLGYAMGQIANRAFDCSANPSCTPYPTGPFGGGGGGGW